MKPESLVNLYLFGKTAEKNVNYGNKNHRKDKLFLKNMYNGMTFFLDFLNDPVEYCIKHKCNIYEVIKNKQNENDIYHIIHNMDKKRYMIIVINLNEDICEYLVTYHKTMENNIKDKNIIQIEIINKIFMERMYYFKDKLTTINKLINDHNNMLADVMKQLFP